MRWVTFVCFCVVAVSIYAQSLSGGNKHILHVSYLSDQVTPVYAKTFETTQIAFGRDEVIESIQNGDLDAWTVSVQHNLPYMMFLKPTVAGSDTNMTVITDKHDYYFHLHSINRSDHQAGIYAIQFSYPSDNVLLQHTRRHQLNKKYTYHGDKALLPRSVYDDGKFTYFIFHRMQKIPAIFAVNNKQGREALVNFRRSGSMLIVQQLARQFTLRRGQYHVLSIFNRG